MDVISSKELEPYRTQFKSRADKALEQFNYLVNMTHPKHMGKRLNNARQKLAEDWVQTVNPSCLPLVMAFQINWLRMMQNKTEKKLKVPTDFRMLMQGLHSAPTSSASLERVFDLWSCVFKTT